MNETPKPSPEQMPEIPNGLSTIVLPDLDEHNHWGDVEPITEQAALAKLNAFLGNLNQQGADIVYVFDFSVDIGKRDGVLGNVSKTKKFAIVRKAGK